jgi:hypothetical protein
VTLFIACGCIDREVLPRTDILREELNGGIASISRWLSDWLYRPEGFDSSNIIDRDLGHISVASIAIFETGFDGRSILDAETQVKFWQYLNSSPSQIKNHN